MILKKWIDLQHGRKREDRITWITNDSLITSFPFCLNPSEPYFDTNALPLISLFFVFWRVLVLWLAGNNWFGRWGNWKKTTLGISSGSFIVIVGVIDSTYFFKCPSGFQGCTVVSALILQHGPVWKKIIICKWQGYCFAFISELLSFKSERKKMVI